LNGLSVVPSQPEEPDNPRGHAARSAAREHRRVVHRSCQRGVLARRAAAGEAAVWSSWTTRAAGRATTLTRRAWPICRQTPAGVDVATVAGGVAFESTRPNQTCCQGVFARRRGCDRAANWC